MSPVISPIAPTASGSMAALIRSRYAYGYDNRGYGYGYDNRGWLRQQSRLESLIASSLSSAHVMNCREAQPQIFAERDGALDHCPARCARRTPRTLRVPAGGSVRDFTAALTAWRVDVIQCRRA